MIFTNKFFTSDINSEVCDLEGGSRRAIFNDFLDYWRGFIIIFVKMEMEIERWLIKLKN